jgi:hypothetical protein
MKEEYNGEEIMISAIRRIRIWKAIHVLKLVGLVLIGFIIGILTT